MKYALRRFITVCVLLLAVVLVLAGCGEKETKTIKIGVVVPQTGAVAAYGEVGGNLVMVEPAPEGEAHKYGIGTVFCLLLTKSMPPEASTIKRSNPSLKITRVTRRRLPMSLTN